MFSIDSGIPAPARRNRTSTVYPFADMRVGDSFAVPADMRAKVYEAARKWRARHAGFNFVLREFGDAWRLWRVAEKP